MTPNLSSISPMLIQYLIGLCCLKWNSNAVDVTIGDMVYDVGAEKCRDVDVTVTIKEHGHITYAFKAYEVKHEREPLDVITTEQLCLKLHDMPDITNRAIVSSSGFTEPAKKKAALHGVELYQLNPWTRPLNEQFPELAMDGTAKECFPASKLLLCWSQFQISLIAHSAKEQFHIQLNDKLFTSKGNPHPVFKTFEKYRDELLLRSTEILFPLEPASTILRTFPVPFTAPDGEFPSGPAWPHTHTINVTSDDIVVETEKGKYPLDLVTISGMLQWQRSMEEFNYYIIEHIPDGEAFAGALITTGKREGHMTCLVFSPKTREINIEFVRLAERHHRVIRNLKLDIIHDESNK